MIWHARLVRVAVIGFDAKPATDYRRLKLLKGIDVSGSRMNCHQFPKVVEWLNEGKINANLMISRTYPVEEIQKAFEDTIANGKDIVKH